LLRSSSSQTLTRINPIELRKSFTHRRIEVEHLKAERRDGKLPENIYAGAPIQFLNVGHAGKQ
jgi:hypothetical protein